MEFEPSTHSRRANCEGGQLRGQGWDKHLGVEVEKDGEIIGHDAQNEL